MRKSPRPHLQRGNYDARIVIYYCMVFKKNRPLWDNSILNFGESAWRHKEKGKEKNFPDLTLSSFDDPSNFLFLWRTSKILIVFFRFFFSLRLGIFYDPDLGLPDLQVSDLFGFFCWNWFWAKKEDFDVAKVWTFSVARVEEYLAFTLAQSSNPARLLPLCYFSFL